MASSYTPSRFSKKRAKPTESGSDSSSEEEVRPKKKTSTFRSPKKSSAPKKKTTPKKRTPRKKGKKLPMGPVEPAKVKKVLEEMLKETKKRMKNKRTDITLDSLGLENMREVCVKDNKAVRAEIEKLFISGMKSIIEGNGLQFDVP